MSLLQDRQPTEDFLDLYIKLDDRQRKKVYQAVMKDRTENIQDIVQNKTVGSILGGGANISERIMSGLSGGGFDKIPVFRGTRAEETFINAAKKELNRDKKATGGLEGKNMKKKIQSLLEDFRNTFDDMPETLSKDAKKDMEAKVVKDKMNENKKSFTKYLPLFEMITQTGEYAEGESKAIDIPKRTPKSMGGASMLEDDRQRYAEPDGPVKDEDGFLGHLDVSKEVVNKVIDGDMATVLELASKYKMDVDGLLMEAKIEKDKREEEREGRAEGGPTDMDSDEEMEEDYLDYILDTALTDEEEEMLMSKLEQDGDMSMLFEKVIDVAQEFAGSGPVEGPGSGVSDSIPARLSDGEFVFTAKAVEEIGADKLMAMMKEAEMEADNRQGLVEGGMPEEEKTVTMEVQEQKEPKVQIAKATVDSTRGLLDEDEISKGIKSKMMLDPLQRHVRS